MEIIHGNSGMPWHIVTNINGNGLVTSPTSTEHTQKHVISGIVSQQSSFQLHSKGGNVVSPVSGGRERLHIDPHVCTQPIFDARFAKFFPDSFHAIIDILELSSITHTSCDDSPQLICRAAKQMNHFIRSHQWIIVGSCYSKLHAITNRKHYILN